MSRPATTTRDSWPSDSSTAWLTPDSSADPKLAARVLEHLESVGADGASFELRPSLRYAHAEPYLGRLAERHGFTLRHRLAQPVREEQGVPIDGLFLYLEKR